MGGQAPAGLSGSLPGGLEQKVMGAGTALLALGAFLLPFWGLGDYNVQHSLPVKPVDLCLALAAPLSLALIWQNRRSLIQSRVFLSLIAVAAALMLSSLLSDDPLLELRTMARQVLWIVSVGGLACLSLNRRSRDGIIRSLIAGGLIAVTVSLIGYLVITLAANSGAGVRPFVFSGTHPVFNHWPRSSGTFGHSPQYWGEYLVVLLAVMMAHYWQSGAFAPRWFQRVGLAIVLLTLGLTFTFAWIAALVVIVGAFLGAADRPRWLNLLGFGVILLAVLLSGWAMHVGPPTAASDRAIEQGIDCAGFDTWHQVNVQDEPTSPLCRPLVVSWPFRSLMTTYWHAKQTAAAIWWDRPWFGVGYRHYRDYARAHLTESFGLFESGIFYLTPHCEALGILATAGVPGGLALILVVVFIVRARPGRGSRRRAGVLGARVIWLGVVGFLVLALSVDILANHGLWYLLGFLIADELKGLEV